MTLERTPTAPVGAALREARIAAGLTIPELAVSAGVGAETVGRIEREVITRPHRATLIALALALPECPTTSEGPAENGTSAKTAGAGGRHGRAV